jgi:15-cis-phytoene synthase
MKRDRRLAQSYSFCGALARREARNFYPAFWLLPRQRREAMCGLYAFLRHTDDLADEPASPSEKASALCAWRRELDCALSGGATAWPGLVALADTVARHEIPPSLLHEAIEGVSMDIEPRPYATFDELANYCYHVASVVGLCCIRIWGYRSDGGEAERHAERCGIALQLTNIIRDVRDDARNSRYYLPQEDLARFGVSHDDLTGTGPPRLAVRELLAFEAARAYELYDHAGALGPFVAPVGRPVLATIVGIYRALLDQIVERDYDVFSSRVSVPKWRKLAIAMRGFAGRLTGQDSGAFAATTAPGTPPQVQTPVRSN